MKYLLLVTILSPIITAYIKQLLPQIPSKWIPLIAPALGGLAEAATRLSVGTDLPEGVGVAAGAAGVAVREVVDQWRKDRLDRIGRDALGLLVVLGLVAGLTGSLGGCAAKAPSVPLTPEQTQAQSERRCQWAETIAASGQLAAVLALQDSTDEKLKTGIATALVGVNSAVASYCDAVRTGQGANAEAAALAGVRAALAELTARTLAPAIASS